MAKVALRFGCAKHSKNLERYLLIKCVKLRFSQVLLPLLYQIYLDIILVAYLLKLNTISTVHVSFVGSDKKKRKRWSSRRFQTGRAMSNFMEVPRTE